eukprot:m51a1_g7346 hypothetical protein (287) ;mRNA; f:223408-224696
MDQLELTPLLSAMDLFVRAGRRRSGTASSSAGTGGRRRQQHASDDGGATRAAAAGRQPRTDVALRSAFASSIAFVLECAAESNEGCVDEEEEAPFCCAPGMEPAVTIEEYVRRIMTYTPWHNELYVAALVYVDRVLAMNPATVILTRRSVHRLFATSVVVASKLLDDLYYTNRYFAAIAGVSTDELNALEIDLLRSMDFNTSAPRWLIGEYLMRVRYLVALERDHGGLVAALGWDDNAEEGADNGPIETDDVDATLIVARKAVAAAQRCRSNSCVAESLHHQRLAA